MNLRSLAFAALLTFMPLQSAAWAQQLLDGATVDEIIIAARDYGSAARNIQPDGNPMISGRIDGIPYTVRFRNCVDTNGCADMNFRVGFLIKPSLDMINTWNRDKRFSKSYLDADGDAILEMDVVLAGGISKRNMLEVFSYWRLTLRQYTSFIGFE